MNFEMPTMTILTSEQVSENAVGPEGCSVKWSGCCYKE